MFKEQAGVMPFTVQEGIVYTILRIYDRFL